MMEQTERPSETTDAIYTAVAVALVCLFGFLVTVGLLAGDPARVVAAILAVIAVALILAHPFTGLVAFIGLIFLRPEDVYPVLAGLRLTFVVGAVTLAGWALRTFVGRKPIIRSPGVPLMLGFVLVALLSAVLQLGSEMLLDMAEQLVKLGVIYYTTVQVLNTERRCLIALAWLVTFTVLLGLHSIYGTYIGDLALQVEGLIRGRGVGIFNDPNDLALMMVMGIPLALVGLLNGRGMLIRIASLLAIGIFLYVIDMSESRGGQIGLAVALVATLARRLKGAGVVLGLMLVAGLIVALQPSRVLEDRIWADESSQDRLAAWDEGLVMLRMNPLLGVGPGMFGVHHIRTAHNSFVLAFAETGLVGVFFWAGLLYFAWQGALRAREACRRSSNRAYLVPILDGLEASMAGFAVSGFFLSRTYLPWLYIYLGIWTALTHAALLALGQKPPALDGTFARRTILICVTGIVLVAFLIVRYHR